MKKIFVSAIMVAALSTGFALKTRAQIPLVNIEVLSTENADVTAPVNFSETLMYNNAGELLGSVKRYDASHVSADISSIINNRYRNFNIVGVEEVTIPSEKTRVYYVHISNDKNLATIKVLNGESELISKYKRG